MRKFKLLGIALDLFDGTAGTGTAEGGMSNGVGSQAISGSDRRSGSSVSDAADYRSKAKAGGSNSEASVAGEQAGEKKLSEKERRAEFRRLVEGDYKDLYESEFQKAFDRRFRNARETQERLDAITPLIDSLAARYDIESGDIGALTEAINKDQSYWESAADDAGMTVEQYQNFLKYKSDSRRLEEMRVQREKNVFAQRQMEAWNNAAREVREAYPEFDIDSMAEDPAFMSMLRAGVPMKHAYEVLNLTGIKAQAAREAAEATEKNVVDGIRAKGARPRENGISSQSGITAGIDVSNISDAQIEEALARARRGETVTFR